MLIVVEARQMDIQWDKVRNSEEYRNSAVSSSDGHSMGCLRAHKSQEPEDTVKDEQLVSMFRSDCDSIGTMCIPAQRRAVNRRKPYQPYSLQPFHHPTKAACLCSPKPLGSLDQADVSCLELVQSYASQDSRGVQKPVASFAQIGVSLLGDVVDDDGLDTHVRVDKHGSCEEGIQGGI